MFMEQEPQIPSRHDRLKVSVASMLFLIQIRPSRTMGPQSVVSTKWAGRIQPSQSRGMRHRIVGLTVLAEQRPDGELNLPIRKLLPAFDDPCVARRPRLADYPSCFCARGLYGAPESLGDGRAL